MKRFLTAAAMTALMTLAPAFADSAADVYNAVKSHVQTAKDYTCSYEYHGPAGEYKFEYRCVRPGDVYTHIVQGPNSGATLVYRPEQNKDKVKAKKSIITISKSVTDKDIANTPIIESAFDMAIRTIGNATPSLKADEKIYGHECYVLAFSNGEELAVDKTTKDILRWKMAENGAPVERDFYDVHFNVGPKIDF